MKKIRITETISTPHINFMKGKVYEFEDSEADRIIAAGQGTADLSETGAVNVTKVRNRQKLDAPIGNPVENLQPGALRGAGGATTQPSQTAAGVESQAGAEVDRHTDADGAPAVVSKTNVTTSEPAVPATQKPGKGSKAARAKK